MKCICSSTRLYFIGVIFLLMNLVVASAMAEDVRLKPFVLADNNISGDLDSISAATVKKLTAGGFDIVGQYSPYENTKILVISSAALRQQAAQSEFGAFGAVQRVTITKTDKGAQIAYTNPIYMSHTYRMKTELADIKTKLASALGNQKQYGSENGLTRDELRDYQYKWLMPYFTDRQELVDYGNQQTALEKIEQTLASGAGGVKKVYRVDLPGEGGSVFGVNMKGPSSNECSGDQYLMSRIDFKAIKSAGHLPYEFVVRKGKAYALFAEFRIAINFPDLSMVGSNSFASIMCAPSAIKTALTKAVGGKEED